MALRRRSFGWGDIKLLFAPLAYIPLAGATVISFPIPVFERMLATPLLCERVRPDGIAYPGLQSF
ncbi:MAG: hypothetical protein P8P70_06055 [Sulfitobacter sp.]|nr:hypothetical protein [Sulfitobacter sp.]MDG1352721.1 hypothetical protein [Sulfitobacter sp.]